MNWLKEVKHFGTFVIVVFSPRLYNIDIEYMWLIGGLMFINSTVVSLIIAMVVNLLINDIRPSSIMNRWKSYLPLVMHWTCIYALITLGRYTQLELTTVLLLVLLLVYSVELGIRYLIKRKL